MKVHLFGHPGSENKNFTACPSKIHWSVEGLEHDLYIKTPTVTILAMDGRRRWLDIKELVTHYFAYFNYCSLCSYVIERNRIDVIIGPSCTRLHLGFNWPSAGNRLNSTMPPTK